MNPIAEFLVVGSLAMLGTLIAVYLWMAGAEIIQNMKARCSMCNGNQFFGKCICNDVCVGCSSPNWDCQCASPTTCVDCEAELDDCRCAEELELTNAWFPTAEACERLDIPSFEGYAILGNALTLNRGSIEEDWESLPIESVEDCTIIDTGKNGVTLRAWNRLANEARRRGQ